MIELKVYNRLIVMKDGMYFIKMHGKKPEWGYSPYMAWHDQSRLYAQKVADKFSGVVRSFNPVTGRVW